MGESIRGLARPNAFFVALKALIEAHTLLTLSILALLSTFSAQPVPFSVNVGKFDDAFNHGLAWSDLPARIPDETNVGRMSL